MYGDFSMTNRGETSADFRVGSRCLTTRVGRNLLLSAGAAIIALAFSSAPSQADQWFLQARGSVSGAYDDNMRLTDKNEKEALGVIVRPELDVHGRGQNWDLNLTNFAAFERYDDSDFDSDNFGINLDSVYRTQLQEFGLDGLVSRETTLATEQFDTGDLADKGIKYTYVAAPYWKYQFTERQSIRLGANVTIADYTKTNRFDDYQTYGGGIRWGYQLTEQDEVTTSFIYSHNNSDDDENSKSDFYGVGLGWRREVSDRLDWFFEAGPRYFDSEQDRINGANQKETDHDSSFGYFLNSELRYKVSELTDVSFKAERAVLGSGGGGATQRNRLRLNANYRFQPRWRASLTSGFTLNQDPNDDNDQRDRNFFTISPRIAYDLTPDWSIWSSYRFRTDNEKGSDRAYSNGVFVGVTYSAPQWTFAN